MKKLDEFKKELEEIGDYHPDERGDVLSAFIPLLINALEEVLALHIENWDNPGSCGNCEWNYPCPTVTDIREALGETE